MKRIPIIIDTDPGVDDAWAILLANSFPGYDLRAITPVAGNVEYVHTSHNALGLAEMLELENTRVTMGADRPLIIPLQTASLVHGNNGMGGYEFKNVKRQLENKKAWDVMYEEACRFPGELVIFAVGPLTNVALAILKYPDLKDKVKSVIIMGGSTNQGNHAPYAEFNIWVDPHAAEVLFHSGIHTVMYGLNATRQAALAASEMAEIIKPDSKVKDLLQEIFNYVFVKRSGGDWGHKMTLHDAIAVAHLMDPEMAEVQPCYVTCEMYGRQTFGQTVVDYKGLMKQNANVDVVMKVDKDKFVVLLKQMIEYYKN